MPLTEAEYKTQILDEVGDEDSFVASRIDRCWKMYDALPVGQVRYLRTKLKAIDLLIGHIRKKAVDYQVQGDLAEKLSQLMTHLSTMRAATAADLKAEQTGAGTGRAPASSTLTTTAPISPPTGYPDANAADYRGTPYPTSGRVQP